MGTTRPNMHPQTCGTCGSTDIWCVPCRTAELQQKLDSEKAEVKRLRDGWADAIAEIERLRELGCKAADERREHIQKRRAAELQIEEMRKVIVDAHLDDFGSGVPCTCKYCAETRHESSAPTSMQDACQHEICKCETCLRRQDTRCRKCEWRSR